MELVSASSSVDKVIAASLAKRFYNFSAALNENIRAAGLTQQEAPKDVVHAEIDDAALVHAIDGAAAALGLRVVNNPPSAYMRSAGEMSVTTIDVAKFDTQRPWFRPSLAKKMAPHANSPSILVIRNAEHDEKWIEALVEEIAAELPHTLVLAISPAFREHGATHGERSGTSRAPRRRRPAPTLKFRPKR